jgi:hypothetical protein
MKTTPKTMVSGADKPENYVCTKTDIEDNSDEYGE